MLCPWCDTEKEDAAFSKGSKQCKPCRKAYRKEYYQKNKAAEIELATNWIATNKERRNEYKRNYTATLSKEEKEEYLAYHRRQWFEKSYGEHWEAAQLASDFSKLVRASNGEEPTK